MKLVISIALLTLCSADVSHLSKYTSYGSSSNHGEETSNQKLKIYQTPTKEYTSSDQAYFPIELIQMDSQHYLTPDILASVIKTDSDNGDNYSKDSYETPTHYTSTSSDYYQTNDLKQNIYTAPASTSYSSHDSYKVPIKIDYSTKGTYKQTDNTNSQSDTSYDSNGGYVY